MSWSPVAYPVDDHGFIRQCAWCLLVADDQGSFTLRAPDLLQGHMVTHGCCQLCRNRLERQAIERARARLASPTP